MRSQTRAAFARSSCFRAETRLAQLSAFGIGLLLGAGLGVVIPEYVLIAWLVCNGLTRVLLVLRGVESVTPHNGSLPTHTIALSLIGGFAAMMLIEQLLPGHAHVGAVAHDAGNKPSNGHNRRFSVAASTASDNELDLDHEIELLESSGGGLNARDSQAAAASRARALPLSMGLVIHCAADGLALGASAVPVAGSGQAEAAALPLIVFLALVIHKGPLHCTRPFLMANQSMNLLLAPTALALSTSLLAAGLPKVAVRKHLIAFSLSSPLSAICTYYALSFLGGSGGSWTGIALLVSVRGLGISTLSRL